MRRLDKHLSVWNSLSFDLMPGIKSTDLSVQSSLLICEKQNTFIVLAFWEIENADFHSNGLHN